MLLLFGGSPSAKVVVTWAELEATGQSAKCVITWAEVQCTDVAVVTPPTVGPVTGGAGWVVPAKKPKKKKRTLLDELDELIIDARSRVVDEPEDDPGLELRREQLNKVIRRAAKLNDEATNAAIIKQIDQLKRIIEDIDEEEAILLLMT